MVSWGFFKTNLSHNLLWCFPKLSICLQISPFTLLWVSQIHLYFLLHLNRLSKPCAMVTHLYGWLKSCLDTVNICPSPSQNPAPSQESQPCSTRGRSCDWKSNQMETFHWDWMLHLFPWSVSTAIIHSCVHEAVESFSTACRVLLQSCNHTKLIKCFSLPEWFNIKIF